MAATDTKGSLNELIDVIIKSKASLFVCAVGVPPKAVVDKLHAAGIPVMNMVGAVKHVKYALDVGADIICAQVSTLAAGRCACARARVFAIATLSLPLCLRPLCPHRAFAPRDRRPC